MSLPRHVQEQADAANKHFESLQNPEPPAPEVDEVTPDAPDTAPQSAEPEQSPDDEKRSEGDSQPETEEPKRSEGYWEAEADYWKNRCNVLKGKYNAEVPALQEKVKSLTQKLDDANQEITKLKSASTQSDNPGGNTDELINQLEEELGAETASLLKRLIATNTSKPDNSADVNELKRKVDQFEQSSREEKEALFWTVLTKLVPDWKAVNTDQKFHAFLAQYDPQTGQQRQQTLNAAQQAMDADGVAEIFNAFKEQSPPPTPRIPEDQVDPQTSRSTSTPQGGKIWTAREIKQFYVDKASGKYSAEEGQRLEADIFQAQTQGRIRG